MKKRVGFLFRDMGTGGAQKIQAFVANSLYKNGYDVVAFNMDKKKCTINLDRDIQIVNVLYEPPHNIFKQLFYKLKYLFQLRRILKKYKIEILCSFLSDVVRISTLALAFSDIKIIGSERGDPTRFPIADFRKYKKSYEKCSAVVFQLANVKNIYSINDSIKQYVIPNPCIPRENSFCEHEFCNTKKVFSAGRLCSQKRFDLLIEAFEIVHNTIPEAVLEIYGDGPLEEELNNIIIKKGLKNIAKIIKNENNVFKVAINNDIFVLASDYEGIPNVIVEAMASGVPVVSTDCTPGGASFLLNQGECGLIVPRESATELAKAIVELLNNIELQKKYSEKGKEYIQSFSIDVIAKQWIKVFEKL